MVSKVLHLLLLSSMVLTGVCSYFYSVIEGKVRGTNSLEDLSRALVATLCSIICAHYQSEGVLSPPFSQKNGEGREDE